MPLRRVVMTAYLRGVLNLYTSLLLFFTDQQIFGSRKIIILYPNYSVKTKTQQYILPVNGFGL